MTTGLLNEPRVAEVVGALPARAWIVGGTVRDELLGRPLRDLDVVVDGDPERSARAIGAALRAPVFALSEAFGAWRVVGRGLNVDVSPLQGDSLEADLRGRDFTVNAIALDPTSGALIDPLGGRADLEARLLRVLGREAYEADPLRPLRLARLATELGLRPEADTARLTHDAAPLVARAAPERVFGELKRIVVADAVVGGLELADRLGLVAVVLPELAALHGVEQSHFHHLDVWGHTLAVLAEQVALAADPARTFGDELGGALAEVLAEPLGDELTRAQALRFGALLHDIAKPQTRSELPGGRVSFLGHDRVGEEQIGAICRRLRTSERLREFLGRLARHHLVLGFMVHELPLMRAATYRYLRTTEPVEVEVTVLSCADRLATRGRGSERAIARHLELARELLGPALAWRAQGPPKPPVRGDTLARALEVTPGPELGELLEALAEARYTGEATTRDEAIALARRLRG